MNSAVFNADIYHRDLGRCEKEPWDSSCRITRYYHFVLNLPIAAERITRIKLKYFYNNNVICNVTRLEKFSVTIAAVHNDNLKRNAITQYHGITVYIIDRRPYPSSFTCVELTTIAKIQNVLFVCTF